jgi:hypothetical protein
MLVNRDAIRSRNLGAPRPNRAGRSMSARPAYARAQLKKLKVAKLAGMHSGRFEGVGILDSQLTGNITAAQNCDGNRHLVLANFGGRLIVDRLGTWATFSISSVPRELLVARLR